MIMLANILAVVFIGFVIGWFWFSTPKKKEVNSNQPLEIIVADGVYTPASIVTRQDVPLKLHVFRKDASPCAEKIIFPELDKGFDLPLEQEIEIELVFPKAGNYRFECQMGMYRGSIQVD